MLRLGLTIAASCLALAGCATINPPADSAQDDRIFTTGSHLPTRPGTGTNSVKTLAAPTADQAMRWQVNVGGPPSSAN